MLEREWRKRNPLTLWWEGYKWYDPLKRAVWRFLKKTKNRVIV